MSKPYPINMPKQAVLLISAAFLLQAHVVRAAGLPVDAQTQARDLLSGTVGGRAKTIARSPAIAGEAHRTPTLDPQEQARRLILGHPNFRDAANPPVAPPSTARDRLNRYSDPQKLAQQMILHKSG